MVVSVVNRFLLGVLIALELCADRQGADDEVSKQCASSYRTVSGSDRILAVNVGRDDLSLEFRLSARIRSLPLPVL